MPSIYYKIIYDSNVAEGAAKDAMALIGLNQAEKKLNEGTLRVTNSTRKYSGAVNKLGESLAPIDKRLTKATMALKKNAFLQKVMARSSHTAGLNVGMLSLRIHEGLIPVLLLAYSAILPVVAGLLAIAAAAGAAAIGIGSVLGLGIAAMSMQNANTNVWGAMNIRSQQTAMEKLLQPLKNAFKSGEIKQTLTVMTTLTQDFFGNTLPDTFKNFVKSLDMDSLSGLFKTFQVWLPRAATSLGNLGNELYNLIGARSLKSINKLFTYLASGLKNTASWLADTGFEDIESFGNILGRFMSKIMELGKVVLPVLTEALESIYPNPIEPVMNKLIEFFDGMSSADTKAIGDLAKLAVALAGINLGLGVITGVIGLLTTLGSAIFPALASAGAWVLATFFDIAVGAGLLASGISAAVGALAALVVLIGVGVLLKLADVNKGVRLVLVTMGAAIINTFIAIWNGIAWVLEGALSLIGKITGKDYLGDVDLSKAYWSYALDDGTMLKGELDNIAQNYTPMGDFAKTFNINTTIELDGEKVADGIVNTNLIASVPSNSVGSRLTRSGFV